MATISPKKPRDSRNIRIEKRLRIPLLLSKRVQEKPSSRNSSARTQRTEHVWIRGNDVPMAGENQVDFWEGNPDGQPPGSSDRRGIAEALVKPSAASYQNVHDVLPEPLPAREPGEC